MKNSGDKKEEKIWEYKIQNLHVINSPDEPEKLIFHPRYDITKRHFKTIIDNDKEVTNIFRIVFHESYNKRMPEFPEFVSEIDFSKCKNFKLNEQEIAELKELEISGIKVEYPKLNRVIKPNSKGLKDSKKEKGEEKGEEKENRKLTAAEFDEIQKGHKFPDNLSDISDSNSYRDSNPNSDSNSDSNSYRDGNISDKNSNPSNISSQSKKSQPSSNHEELYAKEDFNYDIFPSNSSKIKPITHQTNKSAENINRQSAPNSITHNLNSATKGVLNFFNLRQKGASKNQEPKR